MTGTFELPLGFAGGLRDGVTGLVRFGLRDYDPAAGRFVAKDPSFFSGSPENLYNYAGNNPITHARPVRPRLHRLVDVRDVRRRLPVLPRQQVGLGRRLVGLRRGRRRRRRRRRTSTSSATRQDTGGSVFAEVTGKAGWVGGTIGAELDLGCMNAKAGAKVMVGPVTIGADTGGGVVRRRRPERPADAGRPPRGQDRRQGLQEVLSCGHAVPTVGWRWAPRHSPRR